MDALDLQKRCQPLSVDDGEIGRALDALDEKLREWFGALGGTSGRGVNAEPLKQHAEVPAPAEAPAPAEKERVAPEPKEPAAAPEPPAASDEHDERDEQNDEQEEALLATLDPKIATAVRVKRRLSENKRSVRELLAEVEGPREAKREKRQRKSWWR